MHARGVLLAVAALALLAYVLWDADAERPCHYPEADTIDPAPVPPRTRRVATYDGGRTTIPPKVSEAAVARIRARRRSA